MTIACNSPAEKRCTKCGEMKPLSAFGIRSRAKDGLNYQCRACNCANRIKWDKNNPDKKRALTKKWKDNNKDKVRASNARYGVENREKIRKRNMAYKANNKDKVLEAAKRLYEETKDRVLARQKLRRQENRPKMNAKAAKERAAKLQATPSWLTKDHLTFMEVTYAMAKVLTDATGVQHHVDHICPLTSEEVCGLHVPWNLRVIPAKDNLSKGNRLIKE